MAKGIAHTVFETKDFWLIISTIINVKNTHDKDRILLCQLHFSEKVAKKERENTAS